MPTRERIILIIASGLALAVLAALLTRLVVIDQTESVTGWFAYAPNTGPVLDAPVGDDARTTAWAAAGIWLGAILLWTLISLRIFRGPRLAQEDRETSVGG